MITYAIPDIHGRFDLLEIALDNILSGDPGTIVFLGDYVDRGPQSKQVVDCVKDLCKDGHYKGHYLEAPWKGIALQGNHEDMMYGSVDGRYSISWWFSNGGKETVNSYVGKKWSYDDPDWTIDSIPKEHIDWMKSLPLYHFDKNRVFVHANIIEGDEYDKEICLWDREHNGLNRGWKDRVIVHGHTPQMNGPHVIENRINLDGGANWTGNLYVAVFDDAQKAPIDIKCYSREMAFKKT